ncbi:hypothetical protein [Halorubrum gandharaense]
MDEVSTAANAVSEARSECPASSASGTTEVAAGERSEPDRLPEPPSRRRLGLWEVFAVVLTPATMPTTYKVPAGTLKPFSVVVVAPIHSIAYKESPETSKAFAVALTAQLA